MHGTTRTILTNFAPELLLSPSLVVLDLHLEKDNYVKSPSGDHFGYNLLRSGEKLKISILDLEYGLKLNLSHINVVSNLLIFFYNRSIQSSSVTRNCFFEKSSKSAPLSTRFYKPFSKNHFLVTKTSCIGRGL